MPPFPSPNRNHLLATLPAAEFERRAAHLERVSMPLGEILYEPGGQLRHAYFSTTAIVSRHYVIESDASAETAGVPAGKPLADVGIPARRLVAAFVVALHPGADYSDDPDRGLQLAPFDRAATVSLAVVDPRSVAFE